MRTDIPGPPPLPAARTGTRRRIALELLLVASLLAVVLTRFSGMREFARLLLGARLGWILVGLLLQAGTYAATAAVWTTALAGEGLHPPLGPLLRVAVERQSIDHLLPSFGLSGRVVVLRGLWRERVATAPATGAVLADLLSFYVAQAILLGPALWLLHARHELNAFVEGVAALFAVVVAALPVALFWMTNPHARVPGFLLRLRPARELMEALHEVPRRMLRSWKRLAPCVALQASVFLQDAATVMAMLAAVGQELRPGASFTSLMVAEVAGTVGLLPGGLGAYEAAMVAMLALQDVPLPAAMAATLLYRGLALWLPLAPGAWLARRAIVER